MLVGAGDPPAPPSNDAHAPVDASPRRLAAARTSSAGRPAPSVAEARRLHSAEQAGANDEAEDFFDRGRRAEAKGKPGVAKVYYRMAVQRAGGPLRDRILLRLDALESSSGSP